MQQQHTHLPKEEIVIAGHRFLVWQDDRAHPDEPGSDWYWQYNDTKLINKFPDYPSGACYGRECAIAYAQDRINFVTNPNLPPGRWPGLPLYNSEKP